MLSWEDKNRRLLAGAALVALLGAVPRTTRAACAAPSFSNSTPPLAVGSGPFAIASGDFNHDGRLDLAVANEAGNDVSVLLSSGTSSFAVPANYGVGSSPDAIAIGDFNGDGQLDLAVANAGSSNVSIL